GTIAIPLDVTHRQASRQMTGRQAGASQVPDDSPCMTKFELQPKPSRAEEAPATQIGTVDPDDLHCGRPFSSSSGLQSPFSAFRSFPSPERIRVFTVPRG